MVLGSSPTVLYEICSSSKGLKNVPILLIQDAKSTPSVPVVNRKWMVPVPARLPLAFKQRGEKMNVSNYFMLINHSGLLSLDVCKRFPSGA